MTRHRAWTRSAAAVALVLGVAACAPSQDGPLGSSDTSDPDAVYMMCMPVPDGAIGYVGIALENEGDDAVELTGYTVEVDGGGEVALLIDPGAVEHDQMIGSAIWPAEDGLAWMPEVLARAVDPVGAEISPGVTADLLVAVGSTQPGVNTAAGETTVERVELSYRSGSRDYVLIRTGVARVLVDGSC